MAKSVMQEAHDLVAGDRQKDYGHPGEDITRTAALWSAIFGHEVTPIQVCLCMVAIKISRECHGHKRDNLVDMAGWAGVGELVVE